jgi:integrase
MNLTKRGSVWWVDFRLPTGRRVRLSTGHVDKLAATERATALVREAMASEVSTGAAPMALSEALERQYRNHWSKLKGERVMRHTVDVLAREVGHWSVLQATYARLKDYGDGLLRDGKAPATVNRRLSAVGVVLRECARRGEIPARPDLPHYREDNRRERYMTPAEEAAVFGWLWGKQSAAERAPDGTPEWAVVHALALVLLDTGLRFSEALRAAAVEDGRVLDVADGKTASASRRVPMTARAQRAWRALGALPLWFDLRGRRPDDAWAWVSHRWDRATAAAGCPDVTLHILRHTCASRLVQRGVPIFTVSKWLGHSSVKVTERYAKLAPDSLSQALAALEGRPVAVESPQDTTSVHDWSDSTAGGHTAAA